MQFLCALFFEGDHNIYYTQSEKLVGRSLGSVEIGLSNIITIV